MARISNKLLWMIVVVLWAVGLAVIAAVELNMPEYGWVMYAIGIWCILYGLWLWRPGE